MLWEIIKYETYIYVGLLLIYIYILAKKDTFWFTRQRAIGRSSPPQAELNFERNRAI